MQAKKYPYLQGEGLKLISYCPLCNTQYNPLAAKILEEREDAHLIHIECRRCNSSIVALILTGGIGVSSVGLITDLTSDDVLKFKDADDLNLDDVLDFHEALQKDLVLKSILNS
ncbi:MAG: hypothetical protein COT24_01440 [Candidatus Kerfeldbacteria bacterium CG08_land_8_20_14_0_20_40_16]|uniref:Uncharacterized protein n=1 Tax=Candidatus Kerfeldbacteria bacterium CG08_land_8_20_14_0_20_40_16 TaxID=2014244 RepID=A0A2H0YWF2_9BACT|nr:MAG: hypothetical protein COT24_01440 [Candidatus Kerfeldbacteria bacterium CG08_land_8_20_14_0_20_40_16]